MKINFGTWDEFHMLLIVLAAGAVLLGMTGCHFCHEELSGIFMALSALPFVGFYFRRAWNWLHNRKHCLHTPEYISQEPTLKIVPKYVDRGLDRFFLCPLPVYIRRHVYPHVFYRPTLNLPKTYGKPPMYWD